MAFLDTLIEMRNGGVAIECEKALEEVSQGVRKTGKTGKLTLVLTVRAANKGSDVDAVFLADSVRADVPQLTKKETLFFVNEQGQLNRTDGRQMNMLDGIPEEVKR